MCAIAERCMASFFAETKPDPFGAGSGKFGRREFAALVRTIAKRLRLAHATGTPPVISAFFDIQCNGIDNGSVALAHDRAPHTKTSILGHLCLYSCIENVMKRCVAVLLTPRLSPSRYSWHLQCLQSRRACARRRQSSGPALLPVCGDARFLPAACRSRI